MLLGEQVLLLIVGADAGISDHFAVAVLRRDRDSTVVTKGASA